MIGKLLIEVSNRDFIAKLLSIIFYIGRDVHMITRENIFFWYFLSVVYLEHPALGSMR